MIAKTTAERQRELRARRTEEARQQRAAGRVLVSAWMHPEDAAALREHAAKLNKRRERLKEKAT